MTHHRLGKCAAAVDCSWQRCVHSGVTPEDDVGMLESWYFCLGLRVWLVSGSVLSAGFGSVQTCA
jgi:hypothetical protein